MRVNRKSGARQKAEDSDEVAASAEQADGAADAETSTPTDSGPGEEESAEQEFTGNATSRDFSDSAATGSIDEQRDKYLRLAAEYDNYRKRSARERQEWSGRAQSELVKQLIDPLDDLARVAHVETADAQSVIEGVNLVEKKLLKALTAAGLEIIVPVDQPFNPERHEAVATEPALSAEDDHLVSKVYQSGYVFKGQLLRPARVVVKQWNG
ncbi:MAG: nucleotide exchange factor GrpE [Gemmatimonadaceae bacterium]